MMQMPSPDRRRHEREPLTEEVSLVFSPDTVFAAGVDISDSGVCVQSHGPVVLRVDVSVDGEVQTRRAHLVWASARSNGGVRFGLEFVD